MSDSLLIAGIERIADLTPKSLKVSRVLTSEINTCSYTVCGDKPSEYQTVEAYNGSELVFAGTVSKVKEAGRAADMYYWQVSCDDFTRQLDKLLVIEKYTSKTPYYIIKDIIDKYCPGFTYSGVLTGAPAIEAITFNEKYPSACFKELSEYVGWEWDVDYQKDVKWFSGFSELAPEIIDSSATFTNFTHTIDTKTLKNSVRVRGGTMLSDEQILYWKADGAARQWVLPWSPSENMLYVGGAGVSIGIENVTDEATVDYLLNYTEKYIRASFGTTTPAAGVLFELHAKQPIDVITVVDDTDSQLAVAALEGGDGIYELSVVETDLLTIESAEARGNAELRERANPATAVSFVSETPGWEPGQLVTVSLPARGIDNIYLIQKVSITRENGAFKYQVEAGSKLKGIAEFLATLASSKNKEQTADTSLLHKFKYGSETATSADEAENTLRNPPYYCGNADAICGFVVCK